MQDNSNRTNFMSPILINVVKMIANGLSEHLLLTPKEVAEIVNSGSQLFIRGLIKKYGTKFILMRANGRTEILEMECQESVLDNLGLKLFHRFRTSNGYATFVGVCKNYLEFVIDGEMGCSHWTDVSSLKDLQKKHFIEITQDDLDSSSINTNEGTKENVDAGIYANPKIRNIFKKIRANMTLSLKRYEINTLAEYGYLSTFRRSLLEQGIKFLFIKNDRKDIENVYECCADKFNFSDIQFLDQFQIPKVMPQSKAGYAGKIATVVGFKTSHDYDGTGVYLLIDEIISLWSAESVENFSNYGLIKVPELPMQSLEAKHVKFLGEKATRKLTKPEQGFLTRLSKEAAAGNVSTITNMLHCLINRYAKNNFDIVILPTDKKIIRLLLTLVDGSKVNFKVFEVLFSYFCKSKELTDEALWKYLFKQCLLQAIELDDFETVKLLIERNPITYPLAADDFTENELQGLAKIVLLSEKESILAALLINGFYDLTHINNLNIVSNPQSSLLQKAKKFYEGLFHEKQHLKVLITFLSLLNDKEHGLVMLNMLRNLVESIPSLDADVNFGIIKKLIQQLHLCFNEGHGQIYDNYQLILTHFFTLNFDEIANKSIFKDNAERNAFFQQYFSGAIFALNEMNRNNNNTPTGDSIFEKFKDDSDLILSSPIPEMLLEHLNILLYDFQDYPLFINELQKIPAYKFDTHAKEILENYAKLLPPEFKTAIYTKIAEIIELTDGAAAKEYLLKATWNLDNRQSIQLTQFSPLLNNNNAQENRESSNNEQTISNSSL